MRVGRRGARANSLRLACAAIAVGIAVAGCSTEASAPEGEETGQSQQDDQQDGQGQEQESPTSSAPQPSESAELYSLSKPRSGSEGNDETANEALRDFAEAMSTGDRQQVEKVLYAPTPQDQTIIDKSLEIYSDASWDFQDVTWSEDGVHGPCYLLQGEAGNEPVHLTGSAAWNDSTSEWEFATLALPGSDEYPDVPSC